MAPLRLGPVHLHLEVLVLAAVLGAILSPAGGAAVLLVLLTHELAHALAAGLTGGPWHLRLQLGHGGSYLPDGPFDGRRFLVLLAGPVLGVLLGLGLGAALTAVHAQLGQFTQIGAVTWLGLQLLPWPVTDVGSVWVEGLGPRFGVLRVWWSGWLVGVMIAAGVVVLQPALLVPVVVWAGLSVLLARNELAHLRHLKVYEAFEAGKYAEVVAAARSPHWPSPLRSAVAELGLHAALELDDEEGLAHLLPALDERSVIALEAATRLLQKAHAAGARAADRFHARVDGSPKGVDVERYVELTYRHAVVSAREGRTATALGLLERALELGFDEFDRFEAEPAWQDLGPEPRLAAIRARLR